MTDEILKKYEVRKTKAEKSAFICYVKERLKKVGYEEKEMKIEEKHGNKNIIVGNLETAKVLISAHYDTCVGAGFPNIIAPTNSMIKYCYMLLISIIYLGFLLVVYCLVRKCFFAFCLFVACFPVFALFFLKHGPKNKHNANDNTSGVITITKIMEKLAPNQRDKVCAIYFDNEEKGLVGSKRFKKQHKFIAKETMLINFDCVGDGDNIVIASGKKARKDMRYHILILAFYQNTVLKGLKFGGDVEAPGKMSSDHNNFQKGIGVCVVGKRRFGGMYTGRIHTKKDTICKDNNIECLVDTIIDFVAKI